MTRATAPARTSGAPRVGALRRRLAWAWLGLVVATRLAKAAPDAEVDPRDRPHSEPGLLPAFGLSSDTGLQFGVFGQFARYEPGARPYAWRARAQISASVLVSEGSWRLPLNDHFVRLDLPGLPARGSRLFLDLTFTSLTNAGYYGIGNASESFASGEGGRPERYHEYGLSTLGLRSQIFQDLAPGGLRFFGGASFVRTGVGVRRDSRLAEDLASGAVDGAGTYGQFVASVGLLLDQRDHETYPTRGLFHDLVLRASPGGGGAYVGASLTARFYAPLAGERLVFAVRVLADVIGGEAPFFELSRYGGVLGQPGPGGTHGVRGVPQGRYAGKTKAIGNFELRSIFAHARLIGDDFGFGAAAFVDAGRVWARSFAPDARLDGGTLGLHAGYGGGPRVRWGDSLLIRFDIAWAPGAGPGGDAALGTYISADHTF